MEMIILLNIKMFKYILWLKKYIKMKKTSKVFLDEICDIVLKAIVKVQHNASDDGNHWYVTRIEKDGVIFTEWVIYSIWYYIQNANLDEKNWRIWIDLIHNQFYKILKDQWVDGNYLNKLVVIINNRYSKYNKSNNVVNLLYTNIINLHTIEDLDLLDVENINEEEITIHLYIKTFSKNLNKDLEHFFKIHNLWKK